MESARFLSSPEWMDDQKAAVLFSQFREKSLNPHSWDRKMAFWENAVSECVQTKGCMIVDLKSVTDWFERKGKYPKCLDTVLAEMTRSGKLQTMADFEKQNISWSSWGYDTFLRRPLAWGFSKILSRDTSGENITYVVPEKTKKKAGDVLSHHYGKVQHESTDNVLDMATFRTQSSEVLQSDVEFDLVLKQLEIDRKVLVTEDKEGNMVVKVCKQSETKVRPIQEIELNILRIQKVMKHIEDQIESLSQQSDRFTEDARKLVKEGKQAMALHQLRKRKTTHRQIERKSACADTLHEIMQKIEEASSNELVVKAYESGLGALRQMTGDVTVEKVDKVLDDLQEVLGDQEEISQAVSFVMLPGMDVSQDDLEKELDALVADGGKGDTSVLEDVMAGIASYSLADDLPEVPASPPGAEAPKTPSPVLADLPDVPASPPGSEAPNTPSPAKVPQTS